MIYPPETLTEEKVTQLFHIQEDHFNDYKAKDISGQKFSRSVSALANASGGELLVGIREENDTKIKHWEGFNNIESANAFLQIMDSLPHIENFFDVEFLQHPVLNTYVLKITIFKTQAIIKATD